MKDEDEIMKKVEELMRVDGKDIKRLEKQQEYFDKYEKIIVTYFDGGTKDFTPDMWFIFEEKVSKIAKKIKWITKK